MGYIDITILGIVLLVSFKGFYDGFVQEVSTLIGIVAGIFFASRLSGEMAVLFNQYIYNLNSPSVSLILGFIIVLAVFWVGFMLIGMAVSRFVKLTGLGILDRILGYVFSCVKVFCVFAFIIYGLNQIKFIQEIEFMKQLPKNSKVYDAMLDTAKVIVNFDSIDEVDSRIQKLGKNVEKTIKQVREKIPTPN